MRAYESATTRPEAQTTIVVLRQRIRDEFDLTIRAYVDAETDEVTIAVVINHVLVACADLPAGEDEPLIRYMSRVLSHYGSFSEFSLRRQIDSIRARDRKREKEAGRASTLNLESAGVVMVSDCKQADDLFGGFIVSQSLGMIYGERGLGKTFFALNVAYAMAAGISYLKWTAPVPRTVLYLDGELQKWALQDRLASICASVGTGGAYNLQIITPDSQDGPIPDLSTDYGQQLLDDAIERSGAEALFVDNISAVASGNGEENSSESAQAVNRWALRKRAEGLSICFLHHAGKDGRQRGTSKREDSLDYVIALKRPGDHTWGEACRFNVEFEKARHVIGAVTHPFEARLETLDSGKQVWRAGELSTAEDEVLALRERGLTQREIAEKLDIGVATVNRRLKGSGKVNGCNGSGNEGDDHD